MEYCVYVLYNASRSKIYIGHTNNLEKRLARHNGVLPNKNTSFTKRMSGHWKLLHSEEFPTRNEAIRREKELKSAKGREFLKTLRDNHMPL